MAAMTPMAVSKNCISSVVLLQTRLSPKAPVRRAHNRIVPVRRQTMAPALWNDRAQRGFFPYRRFSPRDVELEPRRTSHDGVGGALFIRVRRTNDGTVSDPADP